MRRLKRGRLIVMFLLVAIPAICILLAWLPPLPLELSGDYIPGHPEYCEHLVTDDRGVRLAFTPYAERAQGNDTQIDPNDWQDDPLAWDYMNFGEIFIPGVNFEVTHDGGMVWQGFWQYNIPLYYFPMCDSFASLDADNFWIWTHAAFAVTHDGGTTWFTYNGHIEWNAGRYANIEKVRFDTPETGYMIWNAQSNLLTHSTLLTNDGGKTWHPDPDWIPSSE